MSTASKQATGAEPAGKQRSYFKYLKPQMHVVYATSPLALVGVFLFGWRVLALLAFVFVIGIITEGLFTLPKGKPITTACLVSCMLYTLTLPATVPLWIAGVGIVFGLAIGKMAFGGTGMNVFNPALAGRAFIYVSFPQHMTNRWIDPAVGPLGGFQEWISQPLQPDALSTATPLIDISQNVPFDWIKAFIGYTPGSIGETCVPLLVLGVLWLLFVSKSASWRIVLACLIGFIGCNVIFYFSDLLPQSATPLNWLVTGGFLFGAFFMATDPVSAASTKDGQWIYGLLIGALAVVFRGFSNFPEGTMFAILMGNIFAPTFDYLAKERIKHRKARRSSTGGG
ncbi:MAG: RnfABCDGE type electron transport complex subunit D [Candidatus Alcyoniella australis]|nr:RnfABCDGE type electron transport complex subunit D [Candidatus Alcyoniella australis]